MAPGVEAWLGSKERRRRFDVLRTLKGRKTSWEEAERTCKGEQSRCLIGSLKESPSLREDASIL